MSGSDQAYERRQHTKCRAVPGRVGHLGYRLTKDGGLREIGPVTCPYGHPLVYGAVLVGWDEGCRTYQCQTCGLGANVTMWYCTCKGNWFAAGWTEPVECETEWSG